MKEIFLCLSIGQLDSPMSLCPERKDSELISLHFLGAR